MTTAQSHIRQQEPTSASADKAKQKNFLVLVLVSSAILTGVWFRFTNIDDKIFWKDEVVTRFGIIPKPFQMEVGKLQTKAETLNVLKLDRDKSIVDVTRNLYLKSAEQLPLYYVIARLWCQAFGEGPHVLRLFSVAMGIALLCATYFLGLELFQDRLTASMCAALVALSPYHLSYAQQARPYALLALLITLSGVAYLQAIRKPSFKNWAFFTVSLIAAEYTHLFAGAFVCALIAASVFQKKLTKGFVVSTLISGLSLLPWLNACQTNCTKSHWLKNHAFSVGDHLGSFLKMVSGAVFDLNTAPQEMPAIQALLICSLIVAAILIVAKKAQERTSSFLLATILVPSLLLLTYAINKSTSITLYDRYWTPIFIAVPVCIAGAIGLGLQAKQLQYRILSTVSLVVCLALELVSCVHFMDCFTWHDHAVGMKPVADAINKFEAPAVILTPPPPPAAGLTFCSLLRDDAKVMVKQLDGPLPPDLPSDHFEVNISTSGSNYTSAKYFPAYDINMFPQ